MTFDEKYVRNWQRTHYELPKVFKASRVAREILTYRAIEVQRSKEHKEVEYPKWYQPKVVYELLP
jgi:hypothetical protein